MSFQTPTAAVATRAFRSRQVPCWNQGHNFPKIYSCFYLSVSISKDTALCSPWEEEEEKGGRGKVGGTATANGGVRI